MIEKTKSSADYVKKHAKLNLLIAKKFTETDQLYNKECLRLVIKIFSGYVERYQDNFDFVFLVLKQVVINYIEKSRSSQDITDYVFPLIHLLSSINLQKQKDFVAYADLHKTLLSCVRKLLGSKNVVEEHKEILFNSVVLPGIEELKAILTSTRQVEALDRIKLQSVMMIELIESFASELHIEKFIISVVEGLKIDNFVNNKCYVNEMLAIMVLETIKIVESGKFSAALVETFMDKIGLFLDNSDQFCREFKNLNPEIINKQPPIDQLNNKLTGIYSIIERLRFIHGYYKVDQLGFEGIFREKELLLEAISINTYIKDGFYNNPSFVLIRLVEFLMTNHYGILNGKFLEKIKTWVNKTLSVLEKSLEKLTGNTFESAVLALYLRSLFLTFILKYVGHRHILVNEMENKGALDKRRMTIESLKRYFTNPKLADTPVKGLQGKKVLGGSDGVTSLRRKLSEQLTYSQADPPKTPISKAYLTDKEKRHRHSEVTTKIDHSVQWRLSSKVESEYFDFVREIVCRKKEYVETSDQLKKTKYGPKLYSKALTGIYDIQIAKQFICLLIVPQLLEDKPYKLGKVGYAQLLIDLISFVEFNSYICGIEEEKLVKGIFDVKETVDNLKKEMLKMIVE